MADTIGTKNYASDSRYLAYKKELDEQVAGQQTKSKQAHQDVLDGQAAIDGHTVVSDGPGYAGFRSSRGGYGDFGMGGAQDTTYLKQVDIAEAEKLNQMKEASAAALDEFAKNIVVLDAGKDALEAVNAAARDALINIDNLDVLQAAMLIFGGARQNTEAKARAMLEDLKGCNADIAKLTELMSVVRKARPTGDAKSTGKLAPDVMDALKALNVTLPDVELKDGVYTLKQSQFDVLLDNAKGVSDTLCSKQSLVLQESQKLTNLLQENSDLLTNLQKKRNETDTTIIRNIS